MGSHRAAPSGGCSSRKRARPYRGRSAPWDRPTLGGRTSATPARTLDGSLARRRPFQDAHPSLAPSVGLSGLCLQLWFWRGWLGNGREWRQRNGRRWRRSVSRRFGNLDHHSALSEHCRRDEDEPEPVRLHGDGFRGGEHRSRLEWVVQLLLHDTGRDPHPMLRNGNGNEHQRDLHFRRPDLLGRAHSLISLAWAQPASGSGGVP